MESMHEDDATATAGPEVEIVDNPDASRYELRHDGEVVGHVRYRDGGDGVLVIPHVEVVPQLRGGGHSAPFLDTVLADIDRRGFKVVPTCGYAAMHIRSNPELTHLLA